MCKGRWGLNLERKILTYYYFQFSLRLRINKIIGSIPAHWSTAIKKRKKGRGYRRNLKCVFISYKIILQHVHHIRCSETEEISFENEESGVFTHSNPECGTNCSPLRFFFFSFLKNITLFIHQDTHTCRFFLECNMM